nr:GNAT family N-acetyltransferase [Clostridiales bacterium]
MIFELSNTSIAEHLFAGIDDSMVRSCLQGMMGGKIYVTDPVAPKAAMAFLAEFAFFAGEPDRELASFKPEGVVGLVPPDARWTELIGECWPDVPPVTRYAIRKDTVFNRERLEAIVASLPEGYELKRIDGELYEA